VARAASPTTRLLTLLIVISIGASCGFETGGLGSASTDDAGGPEGELDGGLEDANDAADTDAAVAIAHAGDDALDAEGSPLDASRDASRDAGRDADAGADAAIEADAAADAAAEPDAGVDAGIPGTITSASVVGTTLDRVSSLDQGLAADGTADGTFALSVIGPIDGLLLITTNGSGMISGNSQWDTLVLGDAVPSIGNGFTTGSQTWILGVYEGATRINDADGRVALGPGVHALTLYASDNGTQVSGQHFRAHARATDGTWIAGPVMKW
jgi:hypothetical protein